MNIIKVILFFFATSFSVNTFACDNWEYYDTDKEELEMAVSGSPDDCSYMDELSQLKSILRSCQYFLSEDIEMRRFSDQNGELIVLEKEEYMIACDKVEFRINNYKKPSLIDKTLKKLTNAF